MSTFVDADGVTHQRHGHVTPQPLVARCGGPGMCTVCRAEQAHETARVGVLAARLRADKVRGGRKVPQHLYAQLGSEPEDTDPSIGWAKDAAIVETVVRAVNDGVPVAGARWWCAGDELGALVYDRPGASIASGWVLAVESRAIADRIVAAVRGEAA